MDKKEYLEYVHTHSKKTNELKTLFFSFLIGGIICCIGQGFSDLYHYLIPSFSKDDIGKLVSITMIFLGSFLTGIGLYDKIGAIAGGGSIIPITGFANSIVAPAMEFNKEGQVWDKDREELILHPVFKNAQLILTKLIIENKNMDEIYSYIMQKEGIQDKNIAIEFVEKTLNLAVTLSKSATSFDLYTYKNRRGEDVSLFKGINKYPDKAARIEEFFKICPTAKRSLREESKEIKRRLELPKGKESLTERQIAISKRVEEIDEVLDR